PWWKVDGAWFTEKPVADAQTDVVVGASLASRAGIHPGDTIQVHAAGHDVSLRVSGVLTSAGAEDQAVVAPLSFLQGLTGHPGEYRRMMVSALTRPEDDFARRDPVTMNPADYDKWFCTPYVSSIAFQIRQVLPGAEVRVVRQVAETEGRVMGRLSALFWLVS